MIRCETVTVAYTSVNNIALDCISHLFIRNSDCNTYSLRNAKTDLLAPFMKTSNRRKVFALREAKTRDELSCEAKQAPSLSSFKNEVKNWL